MNMLYFIFLSFSNPDKNDTSSLDEMEKIIKQAVLNPLPESKKPYSADWTGDRDKKFEEDSTAKLLDMFNRAVK
jgi:hypothetical protein